MNNICLLSKNKLLRKSNLCNFNCIHILYLYILNLYAMQRKKSLSQQYKDRDMLGHQDASQVRMLAVKPGDLTSIPGIHRVEGKRQYIVL